MKAKTIIKYALLIFIPLGFGLYFYAANNRDFAEWYAVTIYKDWSMGINFLSSLLPFSLAEFIILSLPVIVVTYIAFRIVFIVKRKGKRLKTLGNSFLYSVIALGLVFFFFVTNCGINYYRYTFGEVSGLNVRDSTVQELYDLCDYLADDLNKYRENLPEDENGAAKFTYTIDEMESLCRQAFDKLNDKYPTLTAGYGESKAILFSHYMSFTNITGFIFPYTFEANVDVDIPVYTISSTACHELAHLRGYMREDEANFISYLACMESDDDMIKYSGSFLAFIKASNSLYSNNSGLYYEVCSKLSDGVVRDLENNTAYWKSFEGEVAEVSAKINDGYLKANSQSDGAKSYGRMVDLLLAYYRNEA